MPQKIRSESFQDQFYDCNVAICWKALLEGGIARMCLSSPAYQFGFTFWWDSQERHDRQFEAGNDFRDEEEDQDSDDEKSVDFQSTQLMVLPAWKRCRNLSRNYSQNIISGLLIEPTGLERGQYRRVAKFSTTEDKAALIFESVIIVKDFCVGSDKFADSLIDYSGQEVHIIDMV
jgi:hypothetical protein